MVSVQLSELAGTDCTDRDRPPGRGVRAPSNGDRATKLPPGSDRRRDPITTRIGICYLSSLIPRRY